LTAQNAYFFDGTNFHLLGSPTYIKTAALNAAGINYQVDDVLNLAQSGSENDATIVVLGVGGGGAITAFQLLSPGNNYGTASGVPVTGGSGSGATFNIITTTINSLGGLNPTGLPYALVKAQSRAYFSNGSQKLAFCDGSADWLVAGDVPGGCRYLTVNSGHLIGAYWTEPSADSNGAVVFNQRVRWSDSNNFEEWDVSLPQFTAGVADVTDAPDDLTGLTTVGTQTNIYRTNGISLMTPTGSAAEPFFIRNFSLAPKGEGCPYPYSLTTHNNIDRFIGNYDVWAFDGTNFTPLMDGKCNGEFFSQLESFAQFSSDINPVRGMITTVLANGYQFLGYVITIPGSNTVWVLNITEGSWTRWLWAPNNPELSGFFDLQFIEQVYTS
jgi:hypothetical protein